MPLCLCRSSHVLRSRSSSRADGFEPGHWPVTESDQQAQCSRLQYTYGPCDMTTRSSACIQRTSFMNSQIFARLNKKPQRLSLLKEKQRRTAGEQNEWMDAFPRKSAIQIWRSNMFKYMEKQSDLLKLVPNKEIKDYRRRSKSVKLSKASKDINWFPHKTSKCTRLQWRNVTSWTPTAYS